MQVLFYQRNLWQIGSVDSSFRDSASTLIPIFTFAALPRWRVQVRQLVPLQ